MYIISTVNIQGTCTAVGIQTRLCAERFGVHIPAGANDFSLLDIIQNDCGVPPCLLYRYTGNLANLPGVKRPGLSVHHQLNLAPRLRGKTLPFAVCVDSFCFRILANLRKNEINGSQSVSYIIKLEVSCLRFYAVWTGKYREA
jgi:hypothetical protein